MSELVNAEFIKTKLRSRIHAEMEALLIDPAVPARIRQSALQFVNTPEQNESADGSGNEHLDREVDVLYPHLIRILSEVLEEKRTAGGDAASEAQNQVYGSLIDSLRTLVSYEAGNTNRGSEDGRTGVQDDACQQGQSSLGEGSQHQAGSPASPRLNQSELACPAAASAAAGQVGPNRGGDTAEDKDEDDEPYDPFE